MFEIWDEAGQAKGLNLQQLQQRLTSYRGEVMVRYINRIGLPTTLFLTVDKGLAYQRFKTDTPCSTGTGWHRPLSQNNAKPHCSRLRSLSADNQSAKPLHAEMNSISVFILKILSKIFTTSYSL